MSRTRRKKRRPLPLKQVLFSALAVLAALFVLILLNEALGSGLPLPGCGVESAAMTAEDMERVRGEFAAAALRAREGGADGVEIHGAHGFLLTQFLSPLFNKRTDEYGGSAENRVRFTREVCSAVRGAVGEDFSLWIKISATEGVEGGYGWDDGKLAALAAIEGGATA